MSFPTDNSSMFVCVRSGVIADSDGSPVELSAGRTRVSRTFLDRISAADADEYFDHGIRSGRPGGTRSEVRVMTRDGMVSVEQAYASRG